MRNANRFFVRAGFVLFCLALVTAFGIPKFLNPKMALAAHMTGVLNALVLIALGLSWGLLMLSPLQEKVVKASFLYATFANWAGSCLAAVWGTSRLTPLSGAGHSAEPWKETLVQAAQISVALTILMGAVLVVYALRPSVAE